jgi:hypothetical protein
MFQMLARRPVILSEVRLGFPQSFQSNAGTEPQKTAPFHIMSTLLFTNYPIIRRCIIQAIGNVVK